MAPYEHSWTGAVTAATLSLPPSVLSRMFGGPLVVDGQPLQPAVRALLSIGGRLGLLGTDDSDIERQRRVIRRGAALVMPRTRGVTVTDTTFPGAVGDLAARTYRPWEAGSQRQPTILYLHGGGWAAGDLDTHDGVCRAIAVASQCNVVSVAYRLAPEHPYPAGLEDVVSVFRYLRDHPTADGVPGVVAVMGDSAGGNLAAALSIVIRDADEDPPVALGLIYPATDLRMQQPSIELFAEGFYLTKPEMVWYRSLYAPDPEQWTDPLISPLLAEDLSNLPPAWIWTAGFDPLRDEGEAYAQRLEAAGNEVRYRCYEDQIHGFVSMGILPGGMARTMDIGRQMGAVARGHADDAN